MLTLAKPWNYHPDLIKLRKDRQFELGGGGMRQAVGDQGVSFLSQLGTAMKFMGRATKLQENFKENFVASRSSTLRAPPFARSPVRPWLMSFTAACLPATITFLSSSSFAQAGRADDYSSFERAVSRGRVALTSDTLRSFAKSEKQRGNGTPEFVLSHLVNISDQVLLQTERQEWHRPFGIEPHIERAMDALAREAGRLIVIHGPLGSGKSEFIKALASDLYAGKVPSGVHRSRLKGEFVILEASAGIFQPHGNVMLPPFLAGVREIQIGTGLNIILKLRDPMMLQPARLLELRAEVERTGGLPIIIEASDKDFVTTLKGAPAFNRYVVEIGLMQPGPRELKQMILSGHKTRLEEQMRLQLSDEVIQAAIDVAPDYRLDLGEPARTIHLLEDFAIHFTRTERQGENPSRQDVFSFTAQRLGLKAVPQDQTAFARFMDDVRKATKAKVVGQDQLVDGLVDQLKAAVTSPTKRHQSAVIMGTTGVGKSYVAEALMEIFFGSSDRVLKIDMTEHKDAQSARNALFGATNGFASYDSNKGAICEFLDGAGKNGGAIILNEFEEATGPVQKLLMELLDTGEVRGGDGSVRRLNRILVIATSNKNSENLMPQERMRTMDPAELDKFLQSITQDRLKEAWRQPSSFTEDRNQSVKAAVPERWDRFYFARPILSDEALKVTELEIAKWVRGYESADQGKLEVNDSFAQTIAAAFYDPAFGARQIRSQVAQHLQRAVDAFKSRFGFEAEILKISARTHPTQKMVSYLLVVDPKSGDRIEIPGPSLPVENPMLDPRFRERIAKLEDHLKSEIFGQDEAVSAIVGSVKNRFLNWADPRSASGMLIGTTGSGKTLLGKSLAKHLYDRDAALGLFEMGKVKDMRDLGTIMSPPPPYIGSDSPAQLETFLINNPDGGVLIFDELSNAGGSDLRAKAEIAKVFYTMLDEGYYFSPATRKRYDLRKYFILFTGNDGEHLFAGAQSDSMAERAYEQATKDPKAIRKVLMDAGLPPAFLNRLWFIKLMRPMIHSVRAQVTSKALDQWRAQMGLSQPIDIEFSNELIDELADLIFDPQRGGRSLSDFFGQVLGLGLGKLSEQFNWDEMVQSGQRVRVIIDVEVQKPTLPFYLGAKPEANKAVVNFRSVYKNTEIANHQIDFTTSANFMPQVAAKAARSTAIHEMGHAVTAFTSQTGKKVSRVSIIPERLPNGLSSAGHTAFRDVSHDGEFDWHQLILQIAGLLAGSEAEKIFGAETTIGRSNDVERAGILARKAILDHHLIPDLDTSKAYLEDGSRQLVQNLPERERKILEDYVHRAMAEGRRLAIKTLIENRHIVVAGTELLMSYGVLTEQEYEELVRRGDEAKTKGSAVRRGLVSIGATSADKAFPISLDGIVKRPPLAPLASATPPVSEMQRCLRLLTNRQGREP